MKSFLDLVSSVSPQNCRTVAESYIVTSMKCRKFTGKLGCRSFELSSAAPFILFAALFVLEASAQPMLVSSVPSNGESGVSPSAAVVFTFSEPMDPDPTTTSASFFVLPSTFLATSQSWSLGNTVLTCTPTPAFPANTMVIWSLNGANPGGDPLSAGGFFTTGTGSGGGSGSGTNKTTTFTVGKSHVFDQTSTAAPVLDATVPYGFSALTSLASNRTASSITVTLPTSAVSNLTQNFVHPEEFYLFASNTNLSTFDATFPSGTYTFSVTGSSNQTVPVTLSASLTQPNAPHVANFTSAQSVNATQAFSLNWDAFTGGTTGDAIFVNVGSVFQTPSFGAAGALNGTATSVMIPANTLQANSNYDASIGFYHATVVSNATFTTIAYIGTITDFKLITTGGPAVTLVMTNASWSGLFNCDVTAPAGQTLTVEFSANMKAGSWSPVLTTNVPAGGRVHVSDIHSSTNRYLFYRAHTGP